MSLACPECGEDVTDSPAEDLHGEGLHEVWCGHCDAEVTVEVRVQITYNVLPSAERTKP